MNFMNIAYKEALKAYKKKEIPVGAVIVKDNKIIAKSHNNRQKKYNVLGHAEINAILKTEKKLRDWRLDGCILYVTLEPCQLCQKVIEESRIDQVIYLLEQDKSKLESNKYKQTNDCNKLRENYQKIINTFFQKLRE